MLPAVDDLAALKALAEEAGKKPSYTSSALDTAVERCSADTLLELFADTRERTVATLALRTQIAKAFSRLGDRRAVLPLLEAYQEMSAQDQQSDGAARSTAVPQVTLFGRARAAIATSLGQLGGPEVVDVMLARLADGDATAVDVLGACGGGDARVVPALIECLKQRGWTSAATTLGKLGDRRAVPFICERLELISQDMDSATLGHQVGLAKALADIGDRAALPALRAIDVGSVSPSTIKKARDYDDGAWLRYLHSCQGIHDAVVALKRNRARRQR